MFQFIIKRFLTMIPVMLGVLLFVFIVSRLSGDPVAGMLGENYTPEQYEEMRAHLGLDKPYLVQFYEYVRGVVTEFDLGASFRYKRPVIDEVRARLPLSIYIAMIAMGWSVAVGTLVGIISAVRQYSGLDYSATVIAMICASMPSFWFGMMLMLLFSLKLGLVPATGIASWRSFILPCITIGLSSVASFCRMTRSTMLEVIRQDYIRTARSKGLSEIKVIMGHALQNSAIPIVTLLGVQMNLAIGNSVVIENVFSIPGLGSYMIEAINGKDYPCVQGAVLVFSMVVCFINLGVDILYGVIDPRIRTRYTGSSLKARLENRKIARMAKAGE